MNNTLNATLKDIVDKNTFVENPLDEFDSYTYTLEWFVCDRETTREFQEHEASMMKDIVTNAWPRTEQNIITIAKTGVTTEFNITDLSIESIGVGNGTMSKIAGTADKISFTCTQVGNTSLADSLQTVVALCGFNSIADAEYFIKINFVGNRANGDQSPINQTKVIPFKIVNYQNLSTTTDARGTTTVLNGQVPADSVVMDADISLTKYGFEYLIGATLADTMTNFEKALNKSIQDNNKTLVSRMKHTYKFIFSEQFKDVKFDQGSMISPEKMNICLEQAGENLGKPCGHALAGMHIYGIVEEICYKSEKLVKEASADTDTRTKMLKITPHKVMRENGYNPVEGKQSYDVIFFIDYEEKIVIQNMPDHFAKIKNARKIVEDIFATGHVNKKYDYLFTGNNDQIIDFNISLDAELTKLYTEPDDVWAYEHFVKPGDSSIKLSVEHQAIVDKQNIIVAESEASVEAGKKVADDYADERTKAKHSLQNAVIKIHDSHGVYMDGVLREANKQFRQIPISELLALVGLTDDGKNIIAKTDTEGRKHISQLNKNPYTELIKEYKIGELIANLKKLDEAVLKAAEELNINTIQSNKEKELVGEEYMNAVASMLNENHDNLAEIGNRVFTDIRNVSPNNQGLLLAEELGSDFMSRLSSDDYKIILKAQTTNPVTFKSYIRNSLEKNKDSQDTIHISQPKKVDHMPFHLAKQKYYEAKDGKLSMIYAEMTIKGDPYWLEGYMPATIKKLEHHFGNRGTSKNIPNVHTKINGFPHIILKSGVAKGTDENENIKTRTLIFSLYQVRTISSSFTNGLFTQSLNMVKVNEAEMFTSETGGVNSAFDEENNYAIPEFTGTGSGTGDDIVSSAESAEETDEQIHTSFWGHFYEMMVNAREEELVEMGEQLEEYAELIVTESAKKDAPLISVEGQAVWRMTTAGTYMNQYKILNKACQSGIETACQSIITSENKILSDFGLTVADKGKLTTSITMSNNINAWIAANPDKNISQEEVAMWQLTAGIPLNITGHDPVDIERAVRDYTDTRTPTYKFSSLPLGATLDNEILTEERTLNVGVNDKHYDANDVPKWSLVPNQEVKINVPESEYVWTRESHLSQIMHPNSNNDWKNTHWFKKKVSTITDESCVWVNGRYGVKDRKLDCTGIKEETLIVDEVNAINSKIEQVDEIIKSTPLSAEDLARQQVWTSDAYEMLESELDKNELVINNTEKTVMQTAIASQINSSVMLDALSNDDYETAAGLVSDINAINSSAIDGSHRSDLTDAVHVKNNQSKLTTLSSDGTVLKNNLDNGFYMDGVLREADKKKLKIIDEEITIVALSQPAESITHVATVITGTGDAAVTEYVPIKNPVTQIAVEDQPILINTQGLPLSTLDVIPQGSIKSRYANSGIAWNYAMANPGKVAQYNEAQNIYKLVTSYDYGDKVMVTDDLGDEIEVKDYNNVGAITYTDANGDSQTISNPSTYFGIYTTTYDDMNPAYSRDYDILRGKIADLFPDIESGQKSQLINGKLPRDKDGRLEITITGDRFYIDTTP